MDNPPIFKGLQTMESLTSPKRKQQSQHNKKLTTALRLGSLTTDCLRNLKKRNKTTVEKRLLPERNSSSQLKAMKMNKIITAATLAGFLGLAGSASAVTATSNVVGYETVTLQPNQFNLVGFRLHGTERSSGTFDGSTDTSLTDSSANFDGLSVVADILGERNVPVLASLPVGHEPSSQPLFLGADATLDADAGTLEIRGRP